MYTPEQIFLAVMKVVALSSAVCLSFESTRSLGWLLLVILLAQVLAMYLGWDDL